MCFWRKKEEDTNATNTYTNSWRCPNRARFPPRGNSKGTGLSRLAALKGLCSGIVFMKPVERGKSRNFSGARDRFMNEQGVVVGRPPGLNDHAT